MDSLPGAAHTAAAPSIAGGPSSQMATLQRPRSAKHSQFKYRRLINLEECKVVFAILMRTPLLRRYLDNEDEYKGHKCPLNCYPKEQVLWYADLDEVMSSAAELLNKQALCPREKPAR